MAAAPPQHPVDDGAARAETTERLDAVDDVAALLERIAERPWREPAEMRGVHRPPVGQLPASAHEHEDDAPVRDVRGAREHLRPGPEEAAQAHEDLPRIAEVLEHFAEDQHVE